MSAYLSRWLFVALVGALDVIPMTGALAFSPTEDPIADATVDAMLAKTLRLRVDADLTSLSAAERDAVPHLLAAGEIFHTLYERSVHRQSEAAKRRLEASSREDQGSVKRLDLFRIFKGPIVTTLENERRPLVDVDAQPPGRNVYPWGATREELDRELAEFPDQESELLHVRTVVRRVDVASLMGDLATLGRYPEIGALHPALEPRLRALLTDAGGRRFYAVPYAVAYADELTTIRRELFAAADLLHDTDEDFAAYLRHRARDLLANDYEAGDAAWVTGSFGNLNAQIGSYETYDDVLFGVKSFFSFSLLVRDAAKSAELRESIGALQEIENALPYSAHKRVRDDIPVGVYQVVADFGQARGTNTASILPNEAAQSRKYGRTILLRYNIMTHPDLFSTSMATFEACVAKEHHPDLGIEGNFYRTLWHEVGHYLGPSVDKKGRELGDALRENSDLIEEMKADLVSLFAARHLHGAGFLTDAQLRSIEASGILRVLQKVKPRRTQPYQTMQLMQWNYFLEKGLLKFHRDSEGVALSIDYSRYGDVATELLREVLALQYEGDKEASDRFIDRYTTWSDDVHEAIAAAARARETYRFRLVDYGALGE